MALQSGNFIVSTGVLVTLLVALGVGYFLVTDSRQLTQDNHRLISDFFGAYNRTITPVIFRLDSQSGQLNNLLNLAIANQRLILSTLNQSAMNGNTTVAAFHVLIDKQLRNEKNIIGNLSDHRRIANITRDTEVDLLKQILNHTH